MCKGKTTKCPWSVWASTNYERNNSSLMIKTLNDHHTCPRLQKNHHANSSWLSKKYIYALRPRKEFKMFEFMQKVRKDFFLAPTRIQVYRAKRKAEILYQGSLATQYTKLWDYADELRRSNPSSAVVIDTEKGLNGGSTCLEGFIYA